MYAKRITATRVPLPDRLRSAADPVWKAYDVAAVASDPEVVDHTAYTMLVDRSGEGRVIYDASVKAEDVVHDVDDNTNFARRGTARSSSVFQSASAWQGWLAADSMLMTGLSTRPTISLNEVSPRSASRSSPPANARMPRASQ